MKKTKVTIATVGCRANQADSATLVRHLDERLVRLVAGFNGVDVAIINTCCVTAEAERDCRKLARRALSSSPGARVILIGCAVNAFPDFAKKIDPRIEEWGHRRADIRDLARWINRLDHPEHLTEELHGLSERGLGRTRALLKIQSGCSHGCAYCIVPRARGKERSLPPAEVYAHMDRLAAEGFREVVLTGVQLGAWGSDLPSRPHLAHLLARAADRFAPGRIRLSSMEPWSVDDALIRTVAEHERICPHLHLPLQSGDDRILSEMGRGYRVRDFLRLVEKAKQAMPGVAIGTDVILGFPGEDEASHRNTLAALAAMEPSYLHAFSYSPRSGTLAAKRHDRPDKATVRARVKEVRDFGAEVSRRFREGERGTLREVIIEEERSQGLKGLTETFVPVLLGHDAGEPGDLIRARVNGIDERDVLHAAK